MILGFDVFEKVGNLLAGKPAILQKTHLPGPLPHVLRQMVTKALAPYSPDVVGPKAVARIDVIGDEFVIDTALQFFAPLRV